MRAQSGARPLSPSVASAGSPASRKHARDASFAARSASRGRWRRCRPGARARWHCGDGGVSVQLADGLCDVPAPAVATVRRYRGARDAALGAAQRAHQHVAAVRHRQLPDGARPRARRPAAAQ
eukprot:scaffold523_cov446-Prasinococcus_capsulatus_cf.AAC.8